MNLYHSIHKILNVRIALLVSLLLLSVIVFPTDELKSKAELKKRIIKLTDDCWRLREKKSDSALFYGKKALQLADENMFEAEIARASGFIGVIYIHYFHQARTSIPYFQKCMEYSLLNNDSVQIAYSYNNLGDAFMLTGNAPLALQYGERSLAIFKKLNHQYGIAYGYINLGLTHRMEANYDEALKYFNLAKELRIDVGDNIGLASVIYEIALLYQLKGELDLALLHYNESLNRHKSLENIKYTAYCLNGIADVHYLKGQIDSALVYYNEARTLNESKKYEFGLIDNHIGLALSNAKQNNVAVGEEYLSKSLELSKKLAIPDKILKTHQTYNDFYNIIGNYKKANNSLNQFLHLYDSLLSLQKFETLNELQNRFFVNQRLSRTQDELANRKKEVNYLLIISFLLALLFLAIFWKTQSQRQLNKKLKQMNQEKDKLFSVISHDLRTPFNSLVGFSELLTNDVKQNNFEHVPRYAELLNKSVDETYKLLTNLLNWSRTQTGRVQFNPKAFFISDLFEDLGNYYLLETHRNKIDLLFENSIKKKILIDVDILQIILSNLISNALKFTREGGQVKVKSEVDQTELIIKVIDNGIGMEREVIDKIFIEHKNYTSRGLRDEKGTGLGLTICNELAKIHRGSIRVESCIGKGSEFIINIPLTEY